VLLQPFELAIETAIAISIGVGVPTARLHLSPIERAVSCTPGALGGFFCLPPVALAANVYFCKFYNFKYISMES